MQQTFSSFLFFSFPALSVAYRLCREGGPDFLIVDSGLYLFDLLGKKGVGLSTTFIFFAKVEPGDQLNV